ncbi:MAG: ribonuclease HI [Desulfohalobiaceae bacterium]|nr:ribonuclease HI [Desulfohalobiaceae bacterium]
MNRSQEFDSIIFTDGACSGNPGPGGWAAVLICNGTSREISGGLAGTTNNRMEIMAMLQGLETLDNKSKVLVITDSRYLHDALNKGWLRRWQHNGWQTAGKKPVKNQDLWKRMLELLKKHDVTIQWTPAHQGRKENERCDELARAAAAKKTLSVDPGA